MPTPAFLRPLIRTLTLTLALALTAAEASAATTRLSLHSSTTPAEGTWELGRSGWTWLGGLTFEIRRETSYSRSFDLPSAAQAEFNRARDGDPIDIRVRYPAGSLRLQGKKFRDSGSGTYTFEPDPTYSAELEKVIGRAPDKGELFDFSQEGISLDFVRAASSASLRSSPRDLLDLRNHGVNTSSIAGYAAAGFKDPRDMIHLRDHGVSTEFAREARDAGYGRDARELTNLRDHGISTDYLRSWGDAGLTPSADELIRLRDHGLQADYATAWKTAGFNLTTDELIRARDHGVSTRFVRELGATGSVRSVDEVIRLQEQGVSPSFVRALATRTPSQPDADDLSTEDTIRLRQQGVEASYYRDLLKANPRFSPEDVIRLRQHGVPSSYISAISIEGRPPLDAETIIDVHDRGLSPDLVRKLRQ